MIPIKQTITRDHKVDPKYWREISQEAWLRAGEHWHRFILRKHFTRGAFAEYNYEPRQKDRYYTDKTGRRRRRSGYETRKFKKFGHRRPLVYTGQLQQLVMRVRDVKATGEGARGGQARITLHGPRYLYQYRKDLTQPDKAAELAAVSPADADHLNKVLTREMDRKLAEDSGSPIDISRGHRA